MIINYKYPVRASLKIFFLCLVFSTFSIADEGDSYSKTNETFSCDKVLMKLEEASFKDQQIPVNPFEIGRITRSDNESPGLKSGQIRLNSNLANPELSQIFTNFYTKLSDQEKACFDKRIVDYILFEQKTSIKSTRAQDQNRVIKTEKSEPNSKSYEDNSYEDTETKNTENTENTKIEETY
jgi:hypothetical protein